MAYGEAMAYNEAVAYDEVVACEAVAWGFSGIACYRGNNVASNASHFPLKSETSRGSDPDLSLNVGMVSRKLPFV